MIDLLIKSLKYFVLCDSYEYMIELIKIKKRIYKNREDQTKYQLLCKFMLVLDIHFYLKCGMWSLAADSMFKFINSFYTVLTFNLKVHLLQNAFYLLLISKQGKAYTPDYALMFLDISYDLNPYYSEEAL